MIRGLGGLCRRIRLYDGRGNTQGYNRYSYGANNPLVEQTRVVIFSLAALAILTWCMIGSELITLAGNLIRPLQLDLVERFANGGSFW